MFISYVHKLCNLLCEMVLFGHWLLPDQLGDLDIPTLAAARTWQAYVGGTIALLKNGHFDHVGAVCPVPVPDVGETHCTSDFPSNFNRLEICLMFEIEAAALFSTRKP